jgi:hypothetical protein
MKSDIQFLIGLNALMALIMILATYKLATLPYPQSDFTEDIIAIRRAKTVEQATEIAGMIAKAAHRRGQIIRKERTASLISAGFVTFVAGSNLYLFIRLRRQMRKGIYFKDGIEMKAE